MFDHFQNMLKLGKQQFFGLTPKPRKINFLEKKNFLIFQVASDMKDSDTKWGMVCMVKVS